MKTLKNAQLLSIKQVKSTLDVSEGTQDRENSTGLTLVSGELEITQETGSPEFPTPCVQMKYEDLNS